MTTGVWTTSADITPGTTQLPPNCATANPAFVSCGTAVAPGSYPLVFNNDAADGSFGVTEPIVLDELSPRSGHLVKAVTVPDNPANGRFEFTETNAFSGDNGRAAILDPGDGPHGTIFAVGNAENGANPELGLTAKNPGLTPTNAYILKGFPTASAKTATDASDYPFGLWFANPTTLYVADEGAGDNTYDTTTNTYSAAAESTTAGLQKWSFSASTDSWQLDYVLQGGLDLGTPYRVTPDRHGDQYPTGLNNTDSGTGLPWAPGTDGLRGLTGQVNRDGTVSLWASTSTVSGSGDQGADPNKLVEITDNLGASTASQVTHERFQTVVQATYGQVVRGVAFTPGTPLTDGNNTSSQPSHQQGLSSQLAAREEN